MPNAPARKAPTSTTSGAVDVAPKRVTNTVGKGGANPNAVEDSKHPAQIPIVDPAISTAGGILGDTGSLLGALGKGSTWIRIAEGVSGIACLFFGVSLLARELGIGDTALKIVGAATPIGKVGGVAKAVASRGAK